MWETLVAVGKSGGWCLQKISQVAIEKSHHFQDHVQIQLQLNSRKKSCLTSPPPPTTTSLLHASLSLMMPSPTIPLSTQQHFHFKTSHAVNTHAPAEGKLLPLATLPSLMAFDLAHNGRMGGFEVSDLSVRCQPHVAKAPHLGRLLSHDQSDLTNPIAPKSLAHTHSRDLAHQRV